MAEKRPHTHEFDEPLSKAQAIGAAFGGFCFAAFLWSSLLGLRLGLIPLDFAAALGTVRELGLLTNYILSFFILPGAIGLFFAWCAYLALKQDSAPLAYGYHGWDIRGECQTTANWEGAGPGWAA